MPFRDDLLLVNQVLPQYRRVDLTAIREQEMASQDPKEPRTGSWVLPKEREPRVTRNPAVGLAPEFLAFSSASTRLAFSRG